MINKERFYEILTQFKQDFLGEHWNNEKYKWEAIKRFQDVWDINATDFLDMFMQSTDKTFNLLANMNNFPRGMIKEFATVAPEFTRAMFINLFDETKDLASRIEKFASDAEQIRIKYDNGGWKSHYQSPNAISTYLSIDEIITFIGVDSKPYFYREFKKRYNTSPSNIRKNKKESP